MTSTPTVTPATDPGAGAAGFAGVTLRRWTTGASLILFSALLPVQAVITPPDGESAVMFTSATDQPGALVASAVLLIVSGILMAPAAVGILHQARGRGSALANAAAVPFVLGGIGHVGMGYYYVLATALPGGDRAEMVAYLDRLNASPVLAVVAFPLLSLFSLGVLLMPWAAFRAGLVGVWAPIVGTLAVVQHLALPPGFPGQELVTTVALVGMAAVFGALGIRILRMGDSAWAPRA